MADRTGLNRALPKNAQPMDHSACIADYAAQRAQEMAGKTPNSCMIEASMKKKAGKPMPPVRAMPSKSPSQVMPNR